MDITDGVLSITEPLFDSLAELTLVDDILLIDGSLGSIGTLTLTNSILSHPLATAEQASRLDLTVNELVIDANSSIDVSGKGHFTGSYRVGGSYGGIGRADSSYGAHDVYGDYHDPDKLIVVNAQYSSIRDGGIVRIEAGSITLDGNIIANGDPYHLGSGGGGGIYIDTGVLTGSGSISANGGDGAYAGGGGRIAVYYDDISALLPTTLKPMAERAEVQVRFI